MFLLLPLSAAAGLAEAAAFAPLSWWPMAFLSVAALTLLIAQTTRLRQAVGLGLVYGLAFNLVTLSWQANVLVASYLGLAVIEAVYVAGLGALLYAVRPLRWAPVAAAAAWVAVEAVQSRFPFGGFGWTRLSYAMIDTPLAGLLPYAAAPAVSFAVALIGQGIAAAVTLKTLRSAVAVAIAAAVAFGAGALGGLAPGAPAGTPTIDVGWVQGGASGEGFYGLGEPGATGRNHAAETKVLLGEVAAGRAPQPAFIVWPENGTDGDPILDPGTNKQVADAVANAGVPILLATPTDGPAKGERQTTYLWWTNAGPTARYDKRDLVPFGEWIPFRDFLLPAIPILSVIGDQAVPGTTPGALHVTGPDGRPLTVGVAICYEVAFAPTVFDAVDAGAEVMIVGSNNAMFQGTAQIEQQFAITRVRAAELRRPILVVTTSGISGLIDEHGGVVFRGAEHVADSGVVSLTRSTALSPALAGGWAVEYLICGLAVVALAWSGVGHRSRRGKPQWTTGAGPQDSRSSN